MKPFILALAVLCVSAQAQTIGTCAPSNLGGTGTVAVMNVYQRRQPQPPGVRIKQMRENNIIHNEKAQHDLPNMGAAIH